MTKARKKASRLRMESRRYRGFKITSGSGMHYAPQHLQRQNGQGPLRNVAKVLAALAAASAMSGPRKSSGRGA